MAFTYDGPIDASTMAYAMGRGGGSNSQMTLEQSLRNPNVQAYLAEYPERRNDVERYLTFNPGDGDRMHPALANDGQWRDDGNSGSSRRDPVSLSAPAVNGTGYAVAPTAAYQPQQAAQTLQELLLAAILQKRAR